MKYWNKSCGIAAFFLFFSYFSLAQSGSISRLQSYVLITKPNTDTVSIRSFSGGNASSLPLKIISENYYTQHFGFFCKKELAVEKITKIPLRIRLGSLQQCNYLEGKVNP